MDKFIAQKKRKTQRDKGTPHQLSNKTPQYSTTPIIKLIIIKKR
jgi:hypothetical protein